MEHHGNNVTESWYRLGDNRGGFPFIMASKGADAGMANIPSAYESPRIENGSVRFYAGDTFEIDLKMEITDNNGLPVTLSANDTIDIVLTSCRGEELLTLQYNGSDLDGSVLTIQVDSELSAKIPAGRHKYDIYLTHDGDRTTVVCGNRLEVF